MQGQIYAITQQPDQDAAGHVGGRLLLCNSLPPTFGGLFLELKTSSLGRCSQYEEREDGGRVG